MPVSLGIIFGLIAMLGLGLNAALAKVPVLKIGGRKTIFFRNACTSLLLFILLLPSVPVTNFSLAYILIAFFIAFIGYIPLLTFYKALKLGKVGVVTPISNSSVVFTILFSIIFFREYMSLTRLSSILLIIMGIIMISLNFKDMKNSQLFKISSGIPYALITCLLWGVVFFLFKIPVMVLGPILTSFIVEFGIMILSGISLAISKIRFSVPDKRILIHIFFVALFGSVGNLFFNMGIEIADVSIVAALTFSNPWIATLYGKFVYKEKLTIPQYVAILLILTGIVLMSYF